MRSNPVEKIGYPIGFVLIFSVVYFVLQVVLGFYVKQAGVAEDFVAEMIRDHELTIQVVSLLIVLFLFENVGKKERWIRWKSWRSLENFIFSSDPSPHVEHPESPWSVMISGLFQGLLLAAVVVGLFRFFGWVQVDRGDFSAETIWLVLPYFFSQSLLFIFWFLLVGRVRTNVSDFIARRESTLRYPFAMRLVYVGFEAQLLFRIFETDGALTVRILTGLFCLLMAATPLFLEDEFRANTTWANHYFWRRKVLKIGAVAGFWCGVFYVFGWKSGIPWKVSLYYSTEGANLPVGGEVVVLGLWVLASNTLLHWQELRRSPSLHALAVQVAQIRQRFARAWSRRSRAQEAVFES